MNRIKQFFSNPWVRLAGRALVAGGTAAYMQYRTNNVPVTVAVATGVLAFAEVFTPLNAVVGVFKQAAKRSGK